MTTGLSSKLPLRMSLSSNLSPRRTSMVREKSMTSMVMVLRTTLRDQEMSSIDSTTLINTEMLEMISITLTTETSQATSNSKTTRCHQRNISSTISHLLNTSTPTPFMVDLMTQLLPPPKLPMPILRLEVDMILSLLSKLLKVITRYIYIQISHI